MFLECLRASIIGLERADLSVIGSHVHDAKNVGAWGKAEVTKPAWRLCPEKIVGSKPAASALFLMILRVSRRQSRAEPLLRRAPSSSPRYRTPRMDRRGVCR